MVMILCLNAMTRPVYAFKLVMLGEYAVGKTSLVKRYLYDSFSPEYYPTLNVNISEKLLRFSKCDNPFDRSFEQSRYASPFDMLRVTNGFLHFE